MRLRAREALLRLVRIKAAARCGRAGAPAGDTARRERHHPVHGAAAASERRAARQPTRLTHALLPPTHAASKRDVDAPSPFGSNRDAPRQSEGRGFASRGDAPRVEGGFNGEQRRYEVPADSGSGGRTMDRGFAARGAGATREGGAFPTAFGGQSAPQQQQGDGAPRRQFGGFAARGGEQPAQLVEDGGADNRFRKFATEGKAALPVDERPVADEASRARFGGLRNDARAPEAPAGPTRSMPDSFRSVAEERDAPSGPSRSMPDSFRSSNPEEEGEEGGGDFRSAPSSSGAYQARGFAVRGGTGPSEGGFGGRRGGDSSDDRRGGDSWADSRDRDTPAAFSGMRRAGGDGGMGGGGGGRDFASFAGGNQNRMPDAFTQGGRGARDRAREDASSHPLAQTVQDRYKVKIMSLADKEESKAASSSGKYAARGPAEAPAAARPSAAAQAQNIAFTSAASGGAAAATSSSLALAPTATASLAKAGGLGDQVMRGTFARAAEARVEDFLADLSKDAGKKAAADLGKLAAASKAALAPYAAELVARRVVRTESGAERKSLGSLLTAMRSGSKKEPALCTDEQVAASLEGAVGALDADLDRRIRVFSVIEAVSAPKTGTGLALGPLAAALLAEAPAHIVEVEEGEEEEEGAGSAPVAPAPAPTVVEAKAVVDSQSDADAAAVALLASGKLGAALLAAAADEFNGFKGYEASAALMTACLKVSLLTVVLWTTRRGPP